MAANSRTARLALLATTFLATFALRIWGVTTYSLVLRDQYRDWEIVQGSLGSLPLLGPATHVGGYTIGPGFYWILWLIRVVFGPWFEYLPHAGGIGQAALQSAVDVLLLVAIWKRTGSVWPALATVTLVATSAFDLSFAATIWNPVVGSLLSKCAIALVLLDWHRREPWRAAVAMGVAWLGVHAYTGAIYVAAAVGLAMVLEPLMRRAWMDALRRGAVGLGAIALLQVPYLWFQVSTQFRNAAMGAVTGSVGQIVAGQAAPELGKSAEGLVRAFREIQDLPFIAPLLPAILIVSIVVVAWHYRRNPTVLLMTVGPTVLALVGYSLFLGALDSYYYLSMMTPMVLTVVLAVTSGWTPAVSRALGVAGCVVALLLVPARFERSVTMNRMPQYAPLVKGSRVLAHRGMPLRAVRTTFGLPPTGDPEFIYRVLGGRIDRAAAWMAVIDENGDVTYQEVGGV